MGKGIYVLFMGIVLISACENKDNGNHDSASITSDSVAPKDSHTTDFEKQHYGNGSTKTSGNSGH